MLVRPSALAALLGALAAAPSASASGCFPEYVAGTSYAAGDVVSATTITSCHPAGTGSCPASGKITETFNYECVSGPSSAFCSQTGFAPGGLYSDSAWTKETLPCTGTVPAPTPVTPPAPGPTPVTPPGPSPALWSGGGCPGAYVAGTAYDAGDVVSVAGTSFTTVYQCADAPTNLFCGQAGFEPGTGQFTAQAWTALGSCVGNLSPTSSPVYSSLMDVGGCPDAYDAHVAYVSGDAVALGGLVYQCKDGPQGLYCPQAAFAPGSTNGAQAWDLLGFCDGTIAPTSSPNFVSLANVGGCPDEFDDAAAYEPGDSVSIGGVVYQCKPEPFGRHCSQDGFEPGVALNAGGGDVEHWRKGWVVAGYCEGTIAPTSSPNFVVLPDLGGCPAGWEWGAFNYEEGDRVSDGVLVYECKAWPFSAHCGQQGYEPNTNPATPLAWKDAWTAVGHCAGSGAPTASPVISVAGSVGVCPEPWMRGSNVAYEEGDMVSVVVSTAPLREVAYVCKAWPFSGFCGQFAPDAPGGDQGWKFAGSCSGSVGPTASPSFDTLSTISGGCPEEWSASTTTYEAGDLVAYSVSVSPARRIVFQCREWPNNGYCNQGSGFEPTTRYAGLAWTQVGTCDGSMAPTSSPAAYTGTCQFNKCTTVASPCVAGTAGCSCGPYDPQTSHCTVDVTTCGMVDVDPWSNAVTYAAGDFVRVGVTQFECRPFPNSLWCSQAAYMPALEDNNVWSQAWIARGDCPP